MNGGKQGRRGGRGFLSPIVLWVVGLVIFIAIVLIYAPSSEPEPVVVIQVNNTTQEEIIIEYIVDAGLDGELYFGEEDTGVVCTSKTDLVIHNNAIIENNLTKRNSLLEDERCFIASSGMRVRVLSLTTLSDKIIFTKGEYNGKTAWVDPGNIIASR